MEERSAIPLWHAAVGTTWAAVAGLLLMWGSPDLAAGQWGAPRLVGATHALTLGWLLTVTVGVLHQLSPAAMGIRPRSISAWRWLLPILSLGTAAVVLGTTLNQTGSLRWGWLAVAMTTATYAWILLGPARASLAGRAVAQRVSFAFGALAATYVLALLRVLWGRLDVTLDIDALRLGHVALGVGGFGTLLGVGVSLHLFPGFFGARDVPVRIGQHGYSLILAGVMLIGLTSLVTYDVPPLFSWVRSIGVVMAAVGALGFVAQMLHWARARRSSVLDPTLAGALLAAVALGTASVVTVFAATRTRVSPTVLTMWGVLMLPGWLTLLIAAVLLRVAPLMSWLERYGALDPAARREVRVAQLVRPSVAWSAIAAIGAGVALMVLGIAIAMSPLVRTGALAFTLGVLCVGFQLVAAWQLSPAVPVPSPLPSRSL